MIHSKLFSTLSSHGISGNLFLWISDILSDGSEFQALGPENEKALSSMIARSLGKT